VDTGEDGVEGVSDESLHDHNANGALRVIRVRTTHATRGYLIESLPMMLPDWACNLEHLRM
jgi:hypothetical protein